MPFYLTQSLHRSLRHHPQRVATVYGTRRHNYRQFAERVARFGGALRALGVTPDDRVAVLTLNSDRCVECYLAILWAGAVVSPLNIRWNAAELRHALDDSGASVLIVDDQFAATAPALTGDSRLQAIIHCGETPAPDGLHAFEDLLEAADPIDDQQRGGNDLAMLLYTGGTTGFPKGVMLSHDNFASASLGMSAMGCGTGGIHLHAVPMFHMAGIQMLFNHLLGGGTHVILPAFQPLAALQLIAHERVDSLMLVPTMLQLMIEHPEVPSISLSSLQRIFYGASPISEALLFKAMSVLPQAEFIQGYGMTETGITLMLPGTYHTAEGQKLGKLRAAGLAAPAAEVRIVDSEDREVARGTPGEIVVRGPTVMRGYWHQPQLSASTLRGGWMHTGDVGCMDDDGFVFIVDRLKDMIVSGGENVYSTEVEHALAQHPAVAMCAVIGIPHDKWGESVHAVVSCQPGSSANEQELIDHCRRLIAAYKCPRSVEFRDTLPLSAAGKLLKNELRAPYWQGRARGVA